jgi:hypothetical protein
VVTAALTEFMKIVLVVGLACIGVLALAAAAQAV